MVSLQPCSPQRTPCEKSWHDRGHRWLRICSPSEFCEKSVLFSSLNKQQQIIFIYKALPFAFTFLVILVLKPYLVRANIKASSFDAFLNFRPVVQLTARIIPVITLSTNNQTTVKDTKLYWKAVKNMAAFQQSDVLVTCHVKQTNFFWKAVKNFAAYRYSDKG